MSQPSSQNGDDSWGLGRGLTPDTPRNPAEKRHFGDDMQRNCKVGLTGGGVIRRGLFTDAVLLR
ncbi:hypothetical protein, partial [Salmonella enterica]|uniref:hypothetical protein n=1 Tax=Salmonella enterica TaxID=28901 RepID=UPI003D291E0E